LSAGKRQGKKKEKKKGKKKPFFYFLFFSKTVNTTLALVQMRLCILKEALPHKGLRECKVDFLESPLERRRVLQEGHELLKPQETINK